MPHVPVPKKQDPRPLSWGLKRLTSGGRLNATRWQDYEYDDNACGQNVTIYILESSALMTHEEFAVGGLPENSRVRVLFELDSGDEHGTFVAGIAAGTTCGVAKKAKIVQIRYLTEAKDIILQQNARPAVLNISQVLISDFTLDENNTLCLVDLIKAGIHVVAAAGNNHEPIPAPWKDPAAQGEDNDHLKSVIWVGGSESSDTKWFGSLAPRYASSFGPVVDLFAPGHNIRSATLEHDKPNEGSVNKFYANRMGTSFAAPHVTGIIACLLSHPSYRNISPKEMKEKILAMAEDAVTGVSLQDLLKRRTKSSVVKPILKDALGNMIREKAKRLMANKTFNLRENFTEEAEKWMYSDDIETLLPLLDVIKDTFDGSEPEFVQVYKDVIKKIMESLVGWEQLKRGRALHYMLNGAKYIVVGRLLSVIKKKRECLMKNKFNLREKFEAKALEMVKGTYVNEKLLPLLAPIENAEYSSAVFTQVTTRVGAEINRSLKDEHVEDSKIFTTTKKLASCKLDRW